VKSSGNAAWGGAQVWISLDGTNYRMADVVYGAARTGAMASSTTSGATSFPLSGLTGQLLNASPADAAALSTLGYIGGASPEYFAYETATLTGVGAYTLTGLVRQAYGTPAGAHAAGDTYVRVDDSVAQYEDLDVSMVGKTIYIKICSFNIYGQAQQGLADVSATTYVITGDMAGYLPGIGGKGLLVNASSTSFRVPQTGAVAPTSITLTAVRTGILSGTVTWSVLTGTATLSVSGDTCTITPGNMSTDTIVVRASISDAVATYLDDTTIVKVYDAPNSGSRVNAALGNLFISQQQSPQTVPAYAGVEFHSDGHIWYRLGTGFAVYVQSSTLWFLDGTPGATYKIRFDLISRDDTGGHPNQQTLTGTFGSLLTLNSTTSQNVLDNVTNGAGTANVLYTIFDSTGTTQLSTGTLLFDVASLP
jgi:hypothetical protein